MNGDYLGFGVGAHSHRHNRRWWTVRDLHAYLRRAAQEGAEEGGEEISAAMARAETMFLGTRLAEGIAASAFLQRHESTVDAVYGRQLTEYVARGFVTRTGGRIALTDEARLFADEIAVQFLEGEEK